MECDRALESKIKECEIKKNELNYSGKVKLELNNIGLGISEIIKKPQNADFYRTKSLEVKFYPIKPNGSCNGYKVIPKSAKYISFPNLRKNFGYVLYGEPIFYNENLKKI